MEQEKLIELESISKHYGATIALDDVSFAVKAGEVIGLIGCNGAGKSTLTRIISGVSLPNPGNLFYCDKRINLASYGPSEASRLGIRVVYQELSLCTNLSVLENFYIEQHANVPKGLGWHKQMLKTSQQALDEVFPDHGIDTHERLGNLSIAQRQIVEIARAVTMKGLKLLILDEPTSSLGYSQTLQLMHYIGVLKEQGVSVLFISHRLSEIIDIADRIIVLQNGKKVWEGINNNIDKLGLVKKMVGEKANASQPIIDDQILKKPIPKNEKITISTKGLTVNGLADINVHFHGGEFIGIAGLEGSGQREFLKAIFFSHGKAKSKVEKVGRLAYVTGDRKKEGIFPIWPLSDNMTITETNKSSFFGKLDLGKLSEKVEEWYDKLSIKAGEGPRTSIVSLSGGNQQKVLVARAMLVDADILILDDPTKGVDVETKQQMLQLFKKAAEDGKLVIWYSTDDEELVSCSRVVVFRYGRIIEDLHDGFISKEKIVEASFHGENLLDRSDKEKRKTKHEFKNLLIPLCVMLAVFGMSGAMQPAVFSRFGIDLLLSSSVPLVFGAIAQMYIIGLSQIDLGVGTYMGLVSVICATVLRQNFWVGVSLIAVMILAYGIMGAIIYLRNIPSIIVSMGMSFVWLGIGYILQPGPGGQAPDWLLKIFSFNLIVPESVLIIFTVGLLSFIFYRSRYGTVLRGFGNNPVAVQRSSWSGLKAYIIGYVISSIFSVMGGVAVTAASRGSDINATSSYTLLTIASVVIGGSELSGGVVSSFGTVIGAITLSLIGSFVGFLRLDSSFVTAVQGMVLIIILAAKNMHRGKL